jgi:hypothetical protein
MNIAVSGMGMNAATLAAPVVQPVAAVASGVGGVGMPSGGAVTQAGELFAP